MKSIKLNVLLSSWSTEVNTLSWTVTIKKEYWNWITKTENVVEVESLKEVEQILFIDEEIWQLNVKSRLELVDSDNNEIQYDLNLILLKDIIRNRLMSKTIDWKFKTLKWEEFDTTLWGALLSYPNLVKNSKLQSLIANTIDCIEELTSVDLNWKLKQPAFYNLFMWKQLLTDVLNELKNYDDENELNVVLVNWAKKFLIESEKWAIWINKVEEIKEIEEEKNYLDIDPTSFVNSVLDNKTDYDSVIIESAEKYLSILSERLNEWLTVEWKILPMYGDNNEISNFKIVFDA